MDVSWSFIYGKELGFLWHLTFCSRQTLTSALFLSLVNLDSKPIFKFSIENLLVSTTDLVSCLFVVLLTIRRKKTRRNQQKPSKPVGLNPYIPRNNLKVWEALVFAEPWKQLKGFIDLSQSYKFIHTNILRKRSNPEVISSLWWRNETEVEHCGHMVECLSWLLTAISVCWPEC